MSERLLGNSERACLANIRFDIIGPAPGDPDFDVVPPESKPEDVCPCCGATTEGGPGPMVRKFEPYEACCLVAGAGSSSSLAFSFQNGPKKVRVFVEEI